ncbi:MAG: MFS transporter, partial [Pseudomonas sp.]|nr:MFS transporter [Pseudomonas sp.]
MSNTVDFPSSTRDPYGVLAAVCLAALILPLTFVGVAVATPAIGRELGGSAMALSWMTNAFML